ncbi:hypothetical protein [Gracilibacillus sp. YIM 98692]|uniref:hypothetical protein n=1 Tax=Gracilibacillus sp. YIM 98692 TaxID=2663532 RepID=UPI0013D5466A|nr:hypothetical protein [Gracilibacillus sp. YIM 98692]
MLRVVVDNTIKYKRKKKDIPTCRTHCELFDPFTEECGVFKDVKVDDPSIAIRCGHMIPKEEPEDESLYLPSTIEDEEESDYVLTEEIVSYDNDNTFYEFNGEKFVEKDSSYPSKPDYDSQREDAIWYISEDESFGCWIINKSKHKFLDVSHTKEVKKGWHEKVYQSPFPLHDHKAALTLASKMVWFVDRDGYGQYALLHDGKVAMISSPRPKGWKPS